MDRGLVAGTDDYNRGFRRIVFSLIALVLVPTAALRDAVARLLTLTVAERRALPYMHPGRADVIGAGALILRIILDRVGAGTVIASEHDILDGIAYSLAADT